MVSVIYQPDSLDFDLDGSFDFTMTSYSAADYIPASLENSPANSPTSTLRGPSTAGRRKFSSCADYFALSVDSAASSSTCDSTVAPKNTARRGSIRFNWSSSVSTIAPEDTASHDSISPAHRDSVNPTRHDSITPEDTVRDGSTGHEPGLSLTPSIPLSPCDLSWVPWSFLCRRMRMYQPLALPYIIPTKLPVFGPQVRTCRCCNIHCSAESLSAELAQESLIVGPQLQALRTELHILINSMTMTVGTGSIKLFESIGAFLDLARIIVDEFDRIASRFQVRWEHRLTPLPESGPPRYFGWGVGDHESLSSLRPAICLGSSTIDATGFCSFWQHCASRFGRFEVVDAADVVIANEFVQRIFGNFTELSMRMRKGNYMHARRVAVDEKIALEKKERKEARKRGVMVFRRKKRIDEVETIGDDFCVLEGDDAMKMEIRSNQIAADAEADEMRRRWARRQNEYSNRQRG